LFCFYQVLFRLLFSNPFFFSLSAPRSSSAPGLRALPDPQGPQLLLLTQARHHLVPATPLPPLWEALQVRGARPLHLLITARRRISPPLLKPKTPAPATPAPATQLPGRRNLWFLLARRRRRRSSQALPPPRPRRILPRRPPLHRTRKLLLLSLPGLLQHRHQAKDLPRPNHSRRRRPPRSPSSSSRGRPAERPWMAAHQAARSL
jgi:hypothetical protein